MLNYMGSEFVEIDGEVLNTLLQQRRLSRFDLAVKMQVTTKTVQRWLNCTIRRVKPDTLEKLAGILKVCPSQIRRASPHVKLRPWNKSLIEFCSERNFDQVRLTDSWGRFREVLKAVKMDTLPSEQQMVVYRNLAVSSFYLGKFTATKIWLERAGQIAQSHSLNESLADILVWKARLQETLGDYDKSIHYLQLSKDLFGSVKKLSIFAEHSYVQGRICLHKGEHAEAIREFRRGVLVSHRQHSRHAHLVGWSHLLLFQTYLRLKDYKKAQVTIKRMLKMAERIGWSRGVLIAYYYSGFIVQFSGGSIEDSQHCYGRARAIKRIMNWERYCPLASQAEFLYFILTGRYQEAKKNLDVRLFKARHAEHYWAGIVLDGVLLSRLNPEAPAIRNSMIARAKKFYESRNVSRPLELLAQLQEKKMISPEQIVDYYYF
ncbi:helix-turn-helix domain-containing protein [Bdellovibrio sp. HCB288]|uniref:helix-turn-helix domain-containing protein n=1 Tax=Bdellovibrio sp. HCB288 TaxID=3394355 RepID=UPI0039B6D9A4